MIPRVDLRTGAKRRSNERTMTPVSLSNLPRKTMPTRRGFPAVLILLVAAAPCLAQGEQKPFVDPAPPKVHELKPMAPPVPVAYLGLKTHRAPKALTEGAVVSDSTGFLGSKRECRVTESHLDLDWPKDGPPLLWETERGSGFSMPVISGNRLILLHRVGDTEHVDCLETTTGKRFWRFSYPCDYKGRYISNWGPRATPLIVDGRVYAHGVQGKLHCLELTTGRVIWKRDPKTEFGVPDDFFGVVGSAIHYGGNIIVQLGAPKGPCVAAFDCKTGRLAWGAGRNGWGPSCSSVALGTVHGKDRLFVLAGGESRPPTGGLIVLDPGNGKIDFEYPFRSRKYESVTASVPVPFDNSVFISSAYGVGSAVLELDDQGGYTETWRNRSIGLQFSNAVHDGGEIWAIDGSSDRAGAIISIDPKTGKETSRTDFDFEENVVHNGRKRVVSLSIGEGSLLAVPGGFICLGDNGHLLALERGGEGLVTRSRAWLFKANNTWTPPAISRGLLFASQVKAERFGDKPPRLLAYDLRK